MVNLLVVYHSARRSDHSNIVAGWEVVSNDDGTFRHWIWCWIVVITGPYVSGRNRTSTHSRSHGLVSRDKSSRQIFHR